MFAGGFGALHRRHSAEMIYRTRTDHYALQHRNADLGWSLLVFSQRRR
jgi:hypothetical protein